MESSADNRLILRLVGHGLDDEDWASRISGALGHTGEEAADEDIAALIYEKEPEADVTADLIRKLKKGSVAHGARTLRKAVEHPTPQWIG